MSTKLQSIICEGTSGAKRRYMKESNGCGKCQMSETRHNKVETSHDVLRPTKIINK